MRVLPLLVCMMSIVLRVVSSSLTLLDGDSRDCWPPGAVDSAALVHFLVGGGGGSA